MVACVWCVAMVVSPGQVTARRISAFLLDLKPDEADQHLSLGSGGVLAHLLSSSGKQQAPPPNERLAEALNPFFQELQARPAVVVVREEAAERLTAVCLCVPVCLPGGVEP